MGICSEARELGHGRGQNCACLAGHRTGCVLDIAQVVREVQQSQQARPRRRGITQYFQEVVCEGRTPDPVIKLTHPVEDLLELVPHPLDFAANVIHDISGLQMIGKHIPGVRLDFQMGRERSVFVELERLLDGEARGAERTETSEKHGNVEVRAPLPGARVGLPRLESIREIEEASEAAILFLDRLREVNASGEAAQSFDDFVSYFRDAHGGNFLQLEDRDAGIDQLLERNGDVLVSDGLMANVEDNAHVPAHFNARVGNGKMSQFRESHSR